MKTVITFLLKIVLFALLLSSHYSFSQKDRSTPVIKEKECRYASHYIPPGQLTFSFAGNPKYVNYYFSDLKKQLFKTFSQKGVPISFTNGTTGETTFFLRIDNAKTIHENDGYDREMRYELTGAFHSDATSAPVLSFTIVVNTVHDINQQNKMVAEYVLEKVMRL